MRRTVIGWLALALTLGAISMPTGVGGQEVPVLTDPPFPLPVYHDRPEKGGFYSKGTFLYWRQTTSLSDVERHHPYLSRSGSGVKEINVVPGSLKGIVFPVVW
jgi:hypothetical protein